MVRNHGPQPRSATEAHAHGVQSRESAASPTEGAGATASDMKRADMVATAPNVIEAGYALAPTDAGTAARWCQRYAKRHFENFTVVSWFLPRRLRSPMYVVYAFCRFTDDLGDEAPGDREALLDEWEADLRRAFDERGRHPITRALGAVARTHPLEPEPFLRLIEANRRDQRQGRYATFQDVLGYCEYSANPVGQMVLTLFGHTDADRRALSDATCTALQLANHWQDVARDYAAGRMYLPLEDLDRFGVREEQIPAQQCDANFRALMQFQVDRAEALFRRGEPLADLVDRDLRIDLQLFTAGGRAVLRAIERQNYDVLTHRPTISRQRKAWLALRALAQRWAGA